MIIAKIVNFFNHPEEPAMTVSFINENKLGLKLECTRNFLIYGQALNDKPMVPCSNPSKVIMHNP